MLYLKIFTLTEGPPASGESIFPILKDDEVHNGKPRQTILTLSKESYDTERIIYDRKNPNRWRLVAKIVLNLFLLRQI